MSSNPEDLKRRKQITLVLLILAAIVLALVVYFQYFNIPPPEEGALRLLKCGKCKNVEIKVVKDITDFNEQACKCSKCGAQLGYAWKCNACKYEFSFNEVGATLPDDIRTMQKLKIARELSKCPNCGSTDTETMSVPVK